MSLRASSISIQEPVLVIEPGRTEKNYWADLWRYRELFLILAWRDISVRYKQTIIGVAWAILRPFLTMVVFTVIFGRVAGLPSDGKAPYALLVFTGMLPWTLFSTALSDASGSLIGNANLISKVSFPRLIVPMATVVTACIDFLISFVILLGLLAYYQFIPFTRLIRFVADRPGHDWRYAIDATKIQQELGWYPRETFETGIHKTVAWYLKRFEELIFQGEGLKDGLYFARRLRSLDATAPRRHNCCYAGN